jgi:hypothetical protein
MSVQASHTKLMTARPSSFALTMVLDMGSSGLKNGTPGTLKINLLGEGNKPSFEVTCQVIEKSIV